LHVATERNAHRGTVARAGGSPVIAIRGPLQRTLIAIFYPIGRAIVPICGAIRGTIDRAITSVCSPIRGSIGAVSCAIRGAVCSAGDRAFLSRRYP